MNIEMKTETETTKTKIKPLKFTGNWFIDAGILGIRH